MLSISIGAVPSTRLTIESQRSALSRGVLRQPSLKAIRLDKDPADLVGSDSSPEPPLPPVKISSPTKVIYSDRGITKGEVAAYYEAVMEHILPGIVDRPLSTIRCPNGANRTCFFQKHHTPGLERVDLIKLKEETGANANYLVVRDEQGLMELVQLNGLEFHPWGSMAEDPDRANRVIFDLDPGPNVSFAEVKKAAQDVRRLLEQMELESFLRTTGGKGLHVVVPLNPGCEWDLVKTFAGGFAEALTQSQPQRFIAVSTLKKRPGKIFVDYLRNGRGATAVASEGNAVLEFAPRTGEPMFIACLFSRWSDPKGCAPELLSFAAITDDPEPEVAAAGHDRTIINIKEEHIDAWLNPERESLAALYAIFDDKQHPYYEHRKAA